MRLVDVLNILFYFSVRGEGKRRSSLRQVGGSVVIENTGGTAVIRGGGGWGGGALWPGGCLGGGG